MLCHIAIQDLVIVERLALEQVRGLETDYEQEAALILFLWAIAIMSYKGFASHRARALLNEDLVPVTEGMKILPEDTREYARQIEANGCGQQPERS